MKSFKFLTLSFIALALCAFTCEDDGCEQVEEYNTTFDLELSSTEASFAVGDKITITDSFSSDIPTPEIDYSLLGRHLLYDFEVFEVQSDNQPVKAVGSKIFVSTSSSTLTPNAEAPFYTLRTECEDNCSFELELELKEAGYFGLVFKNAESFSNDDCVVVNATGIKNEIQNFDILNDIGTQAISYSSSPAPFVIKKDNSLFFKVE